MRKLLAISLVALVAAACSSDPAGPSSAIDATIASLSSGSFGTALTLAGGYDAETYQNRLGNALPDELALTDDQKAQIKALVQAYLQATKPDRDSLLVILHDAREAVTQKKSQADIDAILARAATVRQRLAAAEAKLKTDIDAVLTSDQLAWIAAHTPKACSADNFPPLTDAQKAAIRTLEANFQTAHQADLAAVKAILAEAQTAIRAGASRDDVAAILAKAADPLKRLANGRSELRDKILAVLTPEQRASGCLPLG